MRAKLTEHRVREVYAHLIPTSAAGDLPAVDPAVVERFARELHPIRVLPWIGGVVGKTAFPADEAWIERLLGSVSALLHASSALAGVHLNLEPWLDGDTDILDVVERLRGVLPSGRRLSVAVFPPATTLIVGTTWERDYYARVSGPEVEAAFRNLEVQQALGRDLTFGASANGGLHASGLPGSITWATACKKCAQASPAIESLRAMLEVMMRNRRLVC